MIAESCEPPDGPTPVHNQPTTGTTVSLPSTERQMSFADADFLVAHLFDESTREGRFKRVVMPVLWGLRDRLTALYAPGRGRPAIEPVLLLAVTLLQFVENKTDRAAAQSVRCDMGWKFILGLPLDHEGIHATTLVKFRNRLVAAGMDRLVFDGVVAALREAGLVRRNARRRLDSTHILGAVAALSRNELVRETLRLALDALDGQGRLAALPQRDALLERYVHARVTWGILTKAEREEKFLAAGRDALVLIRWARLQGPAVRGCDAVLMLEQVVLEQYVLDGDGPAGRKEVPSKAVRTPHDADVQWSTKGSLGTKGWLGYKGQIEETAPDAGVGPKKKGEPTEQFLADLHLTPATTGDTAGMREMHQGQRERGEELAPETLVDSGYVSAQTLAEAEAEGRALTGPPRPSRGNKGCFTAEAFAVDVVGRRAVCPAGRTSVSCSPVKERGRKRLHFSWGGACRTCALRPQCTRSKGGRRYLRVDERYDLLEGRRQAMETEAYRARLRPRAGIEGTISEGVRNGMRRSRYRGLAKTSLFLYLMGAACNVRRWMALLGWRSRQDEAFGASLRACVGCFWGRVGRVLAVGALRALTAA